MLLSRLLLLDLFDKLALLDEVATFGDAYTQFRLVVRVCFQSLDLANDVVAFLNSAEDAVLAVEVWRPVERDEELATIGIASCVRHRKEVRLAVGYLEVFILESAAIN